MILQPINLHLRGSVSFSYHFFSCDAVLHCGSLLFPVKDEKLLFGLTVANFLFERENGELHKDSCVDTWRTQVEILQLCVFTIENIVRQNVFNACFPLI